jgi:hypothetical protein
VWATLTSLEPLVQVLSDSAGFDDLPPEAEAASAPAYSLQIGEEITGLLTCPLVLDIESEEGYSTADTLAVLVGASGFGDNMEDGEGEWVHEVVSQGYVDHWHLSQQRSHSDSSSWKCGDTGSGSYFHYEDGGLVSPPILLAQNSTLTFWHWMHAENYNLYWAWDGGLVEISTDGGAHWEQIFPVGGYPYAIYESAPSAGCPFPAGTPCYSGSHDWQEEQFDLSAYSGRIHLRFRFGSDQYTEKEGWYIDDVKVDAASATGAAAPRPQILLSGDELFLIWVPLTQMQQPVRYEIYRADRPWEVVRQEHLVALVDQAHYGEDLSSLSKTTKGLFYAVIAVDRFGRRSTPSPVVGCWRRPVR